MRLRRIFVCSVVSLILSCTGQNFEQGGFGDPDQTGEQGEGLPGSPECEGVGCVPCEELSDCVAILPTADPCVVWGCTDGWCSSESRDEGEVCDDGDVCTLDEQCLLGEEGGLVCQPTNAPCDDGSECTRDLCDPESGCVYKPEEIEGCCQEHSQCDDQNDCTVDLCDMLRATCSHQPVEALCDDGDPCTVADSCSEGKCSGNPSSGCGVFCRVGGPAGSVVECPLDLARLGSEEPSPVQLGFRLEYDGDRLQLHTLLDPACAGDVCVFHSVPQAGTLMAETGHEVALEPQQVDMWAGALGVNLAHPVSPDSPLTLAYFEGGTIEGGDRQLFVFRFTLKQESSDVAVLLKEIEASAAAGVTLGTKLVEHIIYTSGTLCGGDVCFDDNECTTDDCMDDSCVHSPASGECKDGNPCTSPGECDSTGTCVSGPPVGSGEPCSGDDLCTENGVCDGAGLCNPQSALDVECIQDLGDCLESVCNTHTGACYQAPLLGAACDDGDPCTEKGQCAGAGLCVGSEAQCDDELGCTLDTCVPGQGCAHFPAQGVCDDDNPCTQDLCELDVGCVHTPQDGDCDDGNVCTLSDHCLNSGCVGTEDPACGCAKDSDCWFLSQTSLCGGSYSCVNNVCALDVGTVVVCPADGYGCKEDWSCDPTTGQCAGMELTCDDQQPCTADSCSFTKGCKHEWLPGCAAGWSLCSFSGVAGDIVDCPLRVAKHSEQVPDMSGLDIKLAWESDSVELLDLLDEQCVGSSCFPYNLMSCAGTSGACVTNKLQPTGHDILVAPSKKKDWDGALSLVAYHASEPTVPLQPATAGNAGVVIGESKLMSFRFRLLKPASATDPVSVEIKMLEVNPPTGHSLQIQVSEENGEPLFLVGDP